MYKIIFSDHDLGPELSGQGPAYRPGFPAVRMASALSRAGHNVQFSLSRKEKTFENTGLFDFRGEGPAECDLFISTGRSGKGIAGERDPGIQARLKVRWISAQDGEDLRPSDRDYDFYYVDSVFQKERAVREWGLPFEKTVTTRQGFDPGDFSGVDAEGIVRRKRGVVCMALSGQALSAAVGIVDRLRKEIGTDLSLDIYGDTRWRHAVPSLSWVSFKGNVPQRDFCRSLFSYNFMLQLSKTEEIPGYLVQEAKRAGMIVIASGVGGNSELLENGYDGFLIEEGTGDEISYQKIKRLINALLLDENYALYIRENARERLWTWDGEAETWLNHWDQVIKKTPRRRVLISSYYSGYKNLGDEAILHTMIGDVKRIGQDVEVTVVSGDPFETERLHHVRTVPKDDFKLQAREVEDADLVVLASGGVFQDHGSGIKISQFFEDHRYGVSSFANLPLMARMYGKPLVYYAQGVGPLFSDESFQFCRWAFGMADRITVRDKTSYLLLSEELKIDSSKIVMSYDPVLGVEIPSGQRAKGLLLSHGVPEAKRLVCISLRYWIDKDLEKRIVEEAGRALSLFLEDHDPYFFLIVPFQVANRHESESDLTVCKSLSGYLPEGSFAVIENYTNYEEILALYTLADFSIGMRYHSLVLSALAGAPMIGLKYDPKVHSLMSELGLERFCVDPKEMASGGIRRMMDDVLRNRGSLRRTLADAIHGILTERRDSISVLQEGLRPK